MKILLIHGRGRKHGNTERLMQLFSEEVGKTAGQLDLPFELEMIALRDYRIEPCRGCRTCFDRGEEHCPIKDDIPHLIESLRAADGAILASPVYVNDVNGITKSWIDRLAYACHRPDFAGKYAFLVATVGSGPSSFALRSMEYAMNSWGYIITGRSGYKMGALMKRDEIDAVFRKRVARDTGTILHAIHRQTHLRPSFMSLMIFRIQQGYWDNRGHDSYDYTWWKEHGWVNPHTSFYYPVKSSPLALWLARLAGAVIGRFVA